MYKAGDVLRYKYRLRNDNKVGEPFPLSELGAEAFEREPKLIQDYILDSVYNSPVYQLLKEEDE